MTNKITHAPADVISELDKLDSWGVTPRDLLNEINSDTKKRHNAHVFVYQHGATTTAERQLAIVNHVFGDIKLQPEREPRWYVQVESGQKVELDERGIPDIYRLNTSVPYENGMSEKQAKGYAELFGGEAKEIK